MWCLEMSAELRGLGSVVEHTFSTPLMVELVLGQLKIDYGTCSEDIGIFRFMVAECMDFFAKWHSPCHPASVVLAVQRQLCSAGFALMRSADISCTL